MSGAAPTIEVVTTDPAQTMRLGAAVARLCQTGDTIALSGELGAGKTQFVRGMATGLGLDPAVVSSPTFVLVHEYEADTLTLVHIDAYRLHEPGEVETLGLDDLRDGAVIAVEWADRVLDALDDDRLDVDLQHDPAGRAITLTPRGRWLARGDALTAAVTTAALR